MRHPCSCSAWSSLPPLHCSLARTGTKADVFLITLVLINPHPQGLAEQELVMVYVYQTACSSFSGPPSTCTDFPRLAGVRVPVHAAFWQEPGARCSLQPEGWTQTKAIFPSNIFRAQTIHRIPLTERHRSQARVLDFTLQLRPKLNGVWGGGGSSPITYFQVPHSVLRQWEQVHHWLKQLEQETECWLTQVLVPQTGKSHAKDADPGAN